MLFLTTAYTADDSCHDLWSSRSSLDGRAELVEDELEKRQDSLRSRVLFNYNFVYLIIFYHKMGYRQQLFEPSLPQVHLFNRRVKEALARTFFLLFWCCVLIFLLLYAYAGIGHHVFADTIETVNSEYPLNPGIDTDVNTFKTMKYDPSQ